VLTARLLSIVSLDQLPPSRQTSRPDVNPPR